MLGLTSFSDRAKYLLADWEALKVRRMDGDAIGDMHLRHC